MSSNNPYSEITQEILDLSELCRKGSAIDPALYEKLDVKRGLRDINGKGRARGAHRDLRNPVQHGGRERLDHPL